MYVYWKPAMCKVWKLYNLLNEKAEHTNCVMQTVLLGSSMENKLYTHKYKNKKRSLGKEATRGFERQDKIINLGNTEITARGKQTVSTLTRTGSHLLPSLH